MRLNIKTNSLFFRGLYGVCHDCKKTFEQTYKTPTNGIIRCKTCWRLFTKIKFNKAKFKTWEKDAKVRVKSDE